MLLGEFHHIRGSDVIKGVWRLTVHGAIPLAAVVLWMGWKSPWARWVGLCGSFCLLVPVVLRLGHDEGKRIFVTHPEWLVVPAILGIVVLLAGATKGKVDLESWGLGLGDWRWWGPRLLICLACLVPILILTVAASTGLQEMYPFRGPGRRSLTGLMLQILGNGVDLLGWEFLFRGFLLFGIARRGDPFAAIIVPAFPFFLLHGEKPELELVASLIGGLVAGWFTLRARSYAPLFLIHWIQISTVITTAYYFRHLG